METEDIYDRDTDSNDINNRDEAININPGVDNDGVVNAVDDAGADDVGDNAGTVAVFNNVVDDVGVVENIIDAGSVNKRVDDAGSVNNTMDDVGVIDNKVDDVGVVNNIVDDLGVIDDIADDVGVIDDSSNNSNEAVVDDTSVVAEITTANIDTTTYSDDYDNELIIDRNDDNPVAEYTNDVDDITDEEKDSDKDNNNHNNNDKLNNQNQSPMTTDPSIRSDYTFSPLATDTTPSTSSSSSSLKDSDRKNGAKLDAIDLCYSVIINGKLKKILKNINFSLEPGCMCALLGSSTAGKRLVHCCCLW